MTKRETLRGFADSMWREDTCNRTGLCKGCNGEDCTIGYVVLVFPSNAELVCWNELEKENMT